MYSRRDLFAIIATAMLAFTVYSCAHAALPTGYYGRAVLTTPTVTGTHTDTPVLFKTDVGNFPQRDADGGDIRVFSAAGNMMPHEIADLGVDSITIWFEADTLATGQTFYVYSGNDAPPTALATTATWDTASASYHYASTPSQGSTLSDAAGNVDAVAGGTWESAHRGSGQVGTGWYNDDLRGVSVPDLNVTGDWTISAWLRPVGNSTDVIAQGNPWWWFVSAQASNTNPQPSFVARYGTWPVSYAYSGCANDGSWAHYAVTFTTTPDTALTIYRNGVECTNSGIFEYGGANFGGSDISGWYELGYDIDLQGTNFNGGSAPFGLASQSYATGGNQQDQYNGWVDEYQIYPEAFSADKVAALYANQADPVGWFTSDFQFGLTNEPSSVPPPSIIAISDHLQTNYGRVTITGTDFGPHPMLFPDLGVGGGGWIERNPDGTPMGAGYAESYQGVSEDWHDAYNGTNEDVHAKVSTANFVTGTRSIDCSGGDDTVPRIGDPAMINQRMVSLCGGSNGSSNTKYQFREFFASFWYYVDVLDEDGTDGMKYFFWSGHTNHSSKTAVNITTRGPLIDPAWSQYVHVEVFGTYPFTFEDGIDDARDNPETFPVQKLDGDGDLEILDNAARIDGYWQRWEIRGITNSLDSLGHAVPDGLIQMWITDDENDRRLVLSARGIENRDSRDNGRSGPADGGAALWNSFSIQNLASTSGYFNVDIFVDDMYFQFDTQARVELGNAPTLDACTKLFAQEIVSWSDESIEFNMNHGNFSEGDPAWLFVINNRGEVASKAMPNHPGKGGGRDLGDLIGGE